MPKSLLYNPFEEMSFKDDVCFLTGETVEKGGYVTAFPTWLLERYELQNSFIAMLDGSRVRYQDIKVPASFKAIKVVAQLDKETQQAFEIGYEAVVKMPELTIFQWMARVMYGILYQEIKSGVDSARAQNKAFEMSEIMMQKLRNLHWTLQSLIHPIEFKNFTPWSMKCNPVRISRDILNYKDETRKLNFCLNMNGFGIVACLQDNGRVGKYYERDLETIADNILHPVQFEELYGRFIYANYLLKEQDDYIFSKKEDGTVVFELPEQNIEEDDNFAAWDDDLYSQVLANLWQPWGIPQSMVYVFPNSPISYLINEVNYQFIPADAIKLDY